MPDKSLDEIIQLIDGNQSEIDIDPVVIFSRLIKLYREGEIKRERCLDYGIKALGRWPELKDTLLVTALLADTGVSFTKVQALKLSKMQQLYYLLTFSDFEEFKQYLTNFKDVNFQDELLKDNVLIHGTAIYTKDTTLRDHMILNAFSIFETGQDASKKLAYLLQTGLMTITKLSEAIEITKLAIHNSDPRVIATLFNPEFNPYWQQCVDHHVNKNTRQQYDCETFISPVKDTPHNFAAGYTLMHIAAFSDNIDLFAKGFEQWSITRPGRSSIMQEFLEWVAVSQNRSDHPYETILHSAARGGAIKVFKFLLNKGLLEHKDVLNKLGDRNDHTVVDYLMSHAHALYNNPEVKQYNTSDNYRQCLLLFYPNLSHEHISELIEENPDNTKVLFTVKQQSTNANYVLDHGLSSFSSTEETSDFFDYEDDWRDYPDDNVSLDTPPAQSLKIQLFKCLDWLGDLNFNRSQSVADVLTPMISQVQLISLTHTEKQHVTEYVRNIFCNYMDSELTDSDSKGLEQLIELSRQLDLDINAILNEPHGFFEDSVMGLNFNRSAPFPLLNQFIERSSRQPRTISMFSPSPSQKINNGLLDKLNWLQDKEYQTNRSQHIVNVLEPIMAMIKSINLTPTEQKKAEQGFRLILCNYMDSFIDPDKAEGLDLLLELIRQLDLNVKEIFDTIEPKFGDSVLGMNQKREEDAFSQLASYSTDFNFKG